MSKFKIGDKVRIVKCMVFFCPIILLGKVDNKKFDFYNHYKKHFSNFDMKIGKTKNYTDSNGNFTDAYYLINKNVI